MEKIRDVLKDGSTTLKKSSANTSKDSTKKQMTCMICNDIGWYHPLSPDGKPNYTKVSRCPCKEKEDQQKREEILLSLCEIPVHLKKMTFDSFKLTKENSRVYKIAKEMAEEKGPIKFLTLLGDVDCGKTHLAIAICQRWLERRRAAKYAYVPKLLDELREGIEDHSYAYRFNIYCTIPLLLLDDLGLEHTSNWVTERLVFLINTRLDNELPVIVTTNKPLDDLPGDDEHRVASRLTREKFCYVSLMTHTDH